MKFNPIHRELVIPDSFAECFTYELQISWLKKEIDNLSTGGGGESVKVLEEKVATLEMSVATLKNNTNTLTTSVSDIEREINSIKTDLDNVKRNLENFATKDDIKDFISENSVNEKLAAYETIEHAEATFVKKETTGDYVTEEQLDNKLVDYATKIELQEYVTDEQLENYLTKTEADVTYAKKGEIPSDVLTKTEAASTYATKEEIPDVSNFITETEADEKYASKESLVNLTTNDEFNAYKEEVETNYAKKSELPDLSDYAKKSEIPELTDYTTKSYVDTNFLAKNDFDETIQNYVEKSELNNYVTTETAEATYAKKGEIPSDALTKTEAASTYATKEEIPDVSDLATKQELTSGLNGKVSIITFDNVVDTLATKENVEATYAKKSDIPDVSDLVTDTELSQTLEEYATKSEIPEGVIVDTTVSADGQNPVKSQGIYNFVVDQTADLVTNEMLATKQDKLTFDQSPTAGSSNVVTSNGVYSAIQSATHDAVKTSDLSNYATKSEISDMATKSELGGYATKIELEDYATNVNLANYATKSEISGLATKSELSTYATKAELANKQDTLVFDNVPTANSQNPVRSSGIYNAINTATTDMLTRTEANDIFLKKSETTQFLQRKKHILNNDIIHSATININTRLDTSNGNLSLSKVFVEYDRDVYNDNGMWVLDCNLVILFTTNEGFKLPSSNVYFTISKTTTNQNKQMILKIKECSLEIFGISSNGPKYCIYYPDGNDIYYAKDYTNDYYFADLRNFYGTGEFTLLPNNTHYIKVKCPYKLVSSNKFTVDTSFI